MTTKNLQSILLTCLLAINLSFVESIVKSGSRSQGDKEISKGYKYFSEKYIFNISGICEKSVKFIDGFFEPEEFIYLSASKAVATMPVMKAIRCK